MSITLADEPMGVWSKVLTKEQIAKAVAWYDLHSRYVLQITAPYVSGYEPPECKDNPELWKPLQWAWFISHYGASMWYYREEMA